MNTAKYSFAGGFKSLNTEYNNVTLTDNKSAKLPQWLNGSLIKVGPAQFTIGKTQVKHWFDGLAMLYKFEFDNGKVIFSNSFIKSPQYQSHINGQMLYDEFATRAPLGFMDRLKNLLGMMAGKKMLNPSCNVNIAKINKTFIAMTELDNSIIFNPNTLEAYSKITYTDNLDGQMITAHPIYDDQTKELFNVLIYIAPAKVKYQLYKINTQNSEHKREPVAEFNKPYLFYMHSFFITRNHVILYNGPLQTTATALLNHSFNDALKYNKKHNCEFIIINRHNGTVKTVAVKSFVFLHGINSYETENNEVVIDLIVHHNKNNPYNAFYLNKLNQNTVELTTSIRRYTLDLNTCKASCQTILDETVEFPFINQANQSCEYQYIFAAHRDKNKAGDFLNGLIKVNLKNPEQNTIWHPPEIYPSEPIFVKNPDTDIEDDGIIMTNIFDDNRQLSQLLLLDAQSFTEISRFDLPCHIPFTLHGNFYTNQG